MALIKLGQVVSTPGALAFCEANKINPVQLIGRLTAGDFGDLSAADANANVHVIQYDIRILSSNKFAAGKVWLITEADRSSTCLLSPEEY